MSKFLNEESFSFSQRMGLLPLFGPSLFQALSGEVAKVKVRKKGGEAGKRKKEGEPMLPAVSDKNVFRFFRSSASGKPHFSLQQHNAKSAEFKEQLFKDQCL